MKARKSMKIKNKNGNTYTVIETQNNKVLLKDDFGNYIVAIDLEKNYNGEYYWSQGKYFLSDLSSAERYLKSN